MLKILMVGIPLLCPSVGNDIVAGWKTSDQGRVCFCNQPPCAADLTTIADNTVRSGGRNIGSDPDAGVRFQILRDDNSRYGGAD